ncbi:Uncharacterised protein [Vibrio cholerae]|uniref:Uncharacterized protein n=1 Tax=Vibrio cholerae TaxID=666 RepID=A0A656ABA8_VIBCL|nr:Uncharacterised protein [Vibrio cholerae]CRZ83504.1 Uncharacterised protein [Vibrio cholerae]CRZ99986.1 Uncharacterised protein [Vibrio cholerae]CSA20034.1 Uncharacterised protein [Vibrio cholerae]CSB18214.1 Uncharacterised protein [Vibrio cholerae]
MVALELGLPRKLETACTLPPGLDRLLTRHFTEPSCSSTAISLFSGVLKDAGTDTTSSGLSSPSRFATEENQTVSLAWYCHR